MEKHKEKLLDYLEKEYDSLDTRIESITNRAGITATLLTGVAFLVLENEAVSTLAVCLFGRQVPVRLILAVCFFLSIVPLLFVLLFRRQYESLNFKNLYDELYASDADSKAIDCVQYYSELLLLIHRHNKKRFSILSLLYNFSMIFLGVFVILYVVTIVFLQVEAAA